MGAAIGIRSSPSPFVAWERRRPRLPRGRDSCRVELVGDSGGLQDLAVELALKVAELVERIAIEESLAAVGVADVLLLD
jgi:hypothetical protein